MGVFTILLGALVGAGLMYMLDPDRGRRRRALLRDQLVKVMNRSQVQLDDAAHDIGNRAEGVRAEAKQHVQDETMTDETLVARVRSAIGRTISNAGAIEVTTNQGRIMLYGPILENEVAALLAVVRSVSGVTDVGNRLQVHQQAANAPSLQGISDE